MRLKDILNGVEVLESKGNMEIDITNLGSDSRKLSYGALFFAIKGFTLDGTKFIENSIEKGAVAVVVERDFDMNLSKEN